MTISLLVTHTLVLRRCVATAVAQYDTDLVLPSRDQKLVDAVVLESFVDERVTFAKFFDFFPVSDF